MKRLRAQKGLSQTKLADQMQISTSHVAEIELGNRFPSAEVLFTMADILETTPALLLMDPEESVLFQQFKDKHSMYHEVASELLAEVKALINKGR